MKTYKILKLFHIENNPYYTIRLKVDFQSFSGNFVMLWLPGVGERPFSISYQNYFEIDITIEIRGEFTKKLLEYSKLENSYIGIKGPLGNNFYAGIDEKVLMLGGGIGIAPLIFAQKEFCFSEIDLFWGVSKEGFSLPWYNLNPDMIGGNITDKIVSGYDKVFACGPEAMLERTKEICKEKKIPCYLSYEAYMKCGLGLCGECCREDGHLLCKNGTILRY